MANPIPFREANGILGRPVSMTAEECQSVECFRDGEVCITRWQLSDAEIGELKRNGGKVYLSIIGATMPPAKVEALSPFISEPK